MKSKQVSLSAMNDRKQTLNEKWARISLKLEKWRHAMVSFQGEVLKAWYEIWRHWSIPQKQANVNMTFSGWGEELLWTGELQTRFEVESMSGLQTELFIHFYSSRREKKQMQETRLRGWNPSRLLTENQTHIWRSQDEVTLNTDEIKRARIMEIHARFSIKRDWCMDNFQSRPSTAHSIQPIHVI